MLHSTTVASSTADASQPAISAGNHTSCGRSPNSPVNHGGIETGIQPLFATRNRPAITPSPIIDRITVAIATNRSQRITLPSYYAYVELVRERDTRRGALARVHCSRSWFAVAR